MDKEKKRTTKMKMRLLRPVKVVDAAGEEDAAGRATKGCFDMTSTRVFRDQRCRETRSPYETLKRDDHPSQDMSSETEWRATRLEIRRASQR